VFGENWTVVTGLPSSVQGLCPFDDGVFIDIQIGDDAVFTDVLYDSGPASCDLDADPGLDATGFFTRARWCDDLGSPLSNWSLVTSL
jgi:hypothetical protein